MREANRLAMFDFGLAFIILQKLQSNFFRGVLKNSSNWDGRLVTWFDIYVRSPIWCGIDPVGVGAEGSICM